MENWSRPNLSGQINFDDDSLKLRLAQIGIIILFLVLEFSLGLTAPLMQGSDQVAHFYFTRFIAQHGRLPITGEERSEAGYKSDLPPLFHMVVGLTGSGIDLDHPPFAKITRDNPRLQLVFGSDDLRTLYVLTTEDPLKGEILLWYLGRGFTILFAVAGILGAYRLARTVYPRNPWLSLSIAALLAFTPTYVLTSGVISYEPLLGTLLVFYFLVLFYVIRYPNQNWLYLGLGLLMGLAGLTKYTPLPAIPILPLFVIGMAYHQQCTWRSVLWRLILLSLGLTLTLFSWVLFTEIYFNRIDELGWANGVLSPFLASDSSDQTSLRMAGLITGGGLGNISELSHRDTIFQWLWNFLVGIWRNEWLIWIFGGAWFVALVGFIRQWSHLDHQNRLWNFLLGAHIGLFMVLPYLRFVFTGQAVTAEGHHIFFPAGIALILLFVQGLKAWLAPKYLTGVLFVLAGACLWQSTNSVIESYSPPWPIQTVPLTEDEQAVATFDSMSLLNYEFEMITDQSLRITLHWLAETSFSQDYQVELTLLDANGQLQTRWVGQPLNGRYPTRAWMPGDRVRDSIYIPITGLSPGNYQVQLRLVGEAGPIVPVTTQAPDRTNSDTSLQVTLFGNDSFGLGWMALASRSTPTADTITLNGQEIGYTLWQQGRPVGGMPLYEERSTIVLTTREYLGNEMFLSLVDLDGHSYEPASRTGNSYNFNVEPHMISGEYRLRIAKEDGADIVSQVETAPLLRIRTQSRQFEVEPIAYPMSANFAGQIELLGADFPNRRIQPGGDLPVTLHWKALKSIGAHLIIFNHLLNDQQESWGGNDHLARENYSTLFWVPGEIISDAYLVRVASDAPAGIYYLLVGWYLPLGEASVSLPLMTDGQLTDITSVRLGPFKVGKTPPSFTIEQANPQFSLNQPFGDGRDLILLGYDLFDESEQPIQDSQLTAHHLKLTFYWRSESPLSLDYTTFVHVRNQAGENVAQQDQPPLNGAYPTSLWDPGEIIADEITVALPPELPAEEYKIVIGLYDFYTGQRLLVPGNPANEVQLTSVKIH
jgi:hypothetical protein